MVEIKFMKVYFMFQPCKTDASYEMIPYGKFDKKQLVDIIIKEFNGKPSMDTPQLTIIDIDNGKLSVSNNNKILIREVKDEDRAREIANRIMKNLMK